MRPPLPLLRRKNGKALIDFRKAENDDIDALKVRSIQNSKLLLECPTITALVAALDAKAFNDTELLKSYLAGGNRDYQFLQANQPKKSRLNTVYDKTYRLHFLQVSHLFFLICDKKNKHTAHMRSGIKTLIKYNVRITLLL